MHALHSTSTVTSSPPDNIAGMEKRKKLKKQKRKSVGTTDQRDPAADRGDIEGNESFQTLEESIIVNEGNSCEVGDDSVSKKKKRKKEKRKEDKCLGSTDNSDPLVTNVLDTSSSMSIHKRKKSKEKSKDKSHPLAPNLVDTANTEGSGSVGSPQPVQLFEMLETTEIDGDYGNVLDGSASNVPKHERQKKKKKRSSSSNPPAADFVDTANTEGSGSVGSPQLVQLFEMLETTEIDGDYGNVLDGSASNVPKHERQKKKKKRSSSSNPPAADFVDTANTEGSGSVGSPQPVQLFEMLETTKIDGDYGNVLDGSASNVPKHERQKKKRKRTFSTNPPAADFVGTACNMSKHERKKRKERSKDITDPQAPDPVFTADSEVTGQNRKHLKKKKRKKPECNDKNDGKVKKKLRKLTADGKKAAGEIDESDNKKMKRKRPISVTKNLKKKRRQKKALKSLSTTSSLLAVGNEQWQEKVAGGEDNGEETSHLQDPEDQATGTNNEAQKGGDIQPTDIPATPIGSKSRPQMVPIPKAVKKLDEAYVAGDHHRTGTWRTDEISVLYNNWLSFLTEYTIGVPSELFNDNCEDDKKREMKQFFHKTKFYRKMGAGIHREPSKVFTYFYRKYVLKTFQPKKDAEKRRSSVTGKKARTWTKEEDDALIQIVDEEMLGQRASFMNLHWKDIARKLPTRSRNKRHCQQRWKTVCWQLPVDNKTWPRFTHYNALQFLTRIKEQDVMSENCIDWQALKQDFESRWSATFLQYYWACVKFSFPRSLSKTYEGCWFYLDATLIPRLGRKIASLERLQLRLQKRIDGVDKLKKQIHHMKEMFGGRCSLC